MRVPHWRPISLPSFCHQPPIQERLSEFLAGVATGYNCRGRLDAALPGLWLPLLRAVLGRLPLGSSAYLGCEINRVSSLYASVAQEGIYHTLVTPQLHLSITFPELCGGALRFKERRLQRSQVSRQVGRKTLRYN